MTCVSLESLLVSIGQGSGADNTQRHYDFDAIGSDSSHPIDGAYSDTNAGVAEAYLHPHQGDVG